MLHPYAYLRASSKHMIKTIMPLLVEQARQLLGPVGTLVLNLVISHFLLHYHDHLMASSHIMITSSHIIMGSSHIIMALLVNIVRRSLIKFPRGHVWYWNYIWL